MLCRVCRSRRLSSQSLAQVLIWRRYTDNNGRVGMARPASLRGATPVTKSPAGFCLCGGAAVKRPWGYATHLIDCYHAPFWRHMDAFIESGVAVPSCMECGRPVKVRDNCEPVCLDCTWGSAPERATEEVRALRHWPEGRPVVPCWRLFKEPRVLQGSVELLPDHMCEFLWRASTLRWANEHFCPPGGAVPQNNGDTWTPTDLDFDYWQLRWPLPIGAGSIARQADSFARGEVPMGMLPPVLRDENGDFPPEILTPAVSVHGGRIVLEDGCPAPYRLPLIAARAIAAAGATLAPRAPFGGDEHAMWAQRIQVDGRGADVFGTATLNPQDSLDITWGPLRARWMEGDEIDLRRRLPIALRNCVTMWNRAQNKPDARPGRKRGRVTSVEELADAKRRASERADGPVNQLEIAEEARVSVKTASRVLGDARKTWDDL